MLVLVIAYSNFGAIKRMLDLKALYSLPVLDFLPGYCEEVINKNQDYCAIKLRLNASDANDNEPKETY